MLCIPVNAIGKINALLRSKCYVGLSKVIRGWAVNATE